MNTIIIECKWDGLTDYSMCEWTRFVMTIDGVIVHSSLS